MPVITNDKGLVRIENIDRTKMLMRSYLLESKKKLERGLTAAAKFLLKESRKLVPVDTGRLKRSGRVVKSGVGTDGVLIVAVEYDTPYAALVHEDTERNYRTGQAKFLEEPAREYRKTMIWIVQEEMKKE